MLFSGENKHRNKKRAAWLGAVGIAVYALATAPLATTLGCLQMMSPILLAIEGVLQLTAPKRLKLFPLKNPRIEKILQEFSQAAQIKPPPLYSSASEDKNASIVGGRRMVLNQPYISNSFTADMYNSLCEENKKEIGPYEKIQKDYEDDQKMTIAHEFSHFKNNDYPHRLALLYTLALPAFLLMGDPLALLANICAIFAVNFYRQQNEFIADADAARLMGTGVPFIQNFKNSLMLEQLQKRHHHATHSVKPIKKYITGPLSQALSTHPSLEARIKNLETLEPSLTRKPEQTLTP